LAKAVVKAGTLGSTALPPSAKATQAGPPKSRFTVIDNAGAINLAKTDAL